MSDLTLYGDRNAEPALLTADDLVMGDLIDNAGDLPMGDFNEYGDDAILGDSYGDSDPVKVLAKAMGVSGDDQAVGDLVGDLLTGNPQRWSKLQNVVRSAPAKQSQNIRNSVNKLMSNSNTSTSANLPPFVIRNGNPVTFNTRLRHKAEFLRYWFQRFETQYIGTSIIESQFNSSSGAIDAKFTMSAATASTQITVAGPILIIIRASTLNTVNESTIGITFRVDNNFSVTESGASYQQWGELTIACTATKALTASYILLFPFIEVASLLRPVGIQCNNTHPLRLTIKRLPPQYTAEVHLMAPDHKYWGDVKTRFSLGVV